LDLREEVATSKTISLQKDLSSTDSSSRWFSIKTEQTYAGIE
jgi:hypothetical protein